MRLVHAAKGMGGRWRGVCAGAATPPPDDEGGAVGLRDAVGLWYRAGPPDAMRGPLKIGSSGPATVWMNLLGNVVSLA